MTPLEQKVARDLHRTMKETFDELERVKAEREELAEALKLCLDKLTVMREHFKHKWPLDLSPIRAETAARAALAKLEAK